jgi:hypothetical protein
MKRFVTFAMYLLLKQSSSMTVVNSKEFVINEDKYFDLAMNEQVFVQRDNMMFIITRANVNNKKKRLKPDDELSRALTGDELLERVYKSIDHFFSENEESTFHT